jgi:hypothetical protein
VNRAWGADIRDWRLFDADEATDKRPISCFIPVLKLLNSTR